jgi:hypothetical protein
MYATAPVKLCWLQKPQIKPSKVTERHRVPEEVLLQRSLLLIKCLFFLLDVLFDESLPIVVEMLEDNSLLVWICWLAGTLSGCNQSFKLLLTLCVIVSGVSGGKEVR